MHGGADTGSIIYSGRSVGVAAGARYRRAAAVAVHVPAAQDPTVHTLPLRRVAAGRASTADDCGV